MAGLFDTLGTATRGLQAVQRGIATAGHNIANVETPGYSRQNSVLQTTLPQPSRDGTIGSGVEQVTVERIIDRFVAARLNSETSRQGELETEAGIYSAIESIINDQVAGGLTGELSAFFDSLDELSNSAEPGQPIERGQVIAAAQSLVDTIHDYDAQLRSLQRDTDREITSSLPEINSLISEIAELNGEIQVAQTISQPNDLLDKRDLLIQRLAEKINLTATIEEDGSASVRLQGGLTLVDHSTAAEFVAVVDPNNLNAFDSTFSQVFFRNGGSFFDASSIIKGGELGGLLESRDNIIAGVVRDLDAFAFTMSDTFNQIHRGGIGLDDGVSRDFFTDLSATQTTVDDAARNLSLAAAIDPAQGGSARNIAAATPPGSPGGLEGDTSWIEELKNLRTERVPNYLAGDTIGTPTGNALVVAGGIANLIADVGQQVRTTARSLEQQEAILASVQDRRDSVSGVSIDEEVSDLVRLQANFQANARVISTVSSLMQDLLDAL